MSTTDEQGYTGRDDRDARGDDAEELAQSGGVGIGAGEPNTFEPEEVPEAAPTEPTD